MKFKYPKRKYGSLLSFLVNKNSYMKKCISVLIKAFSKLICLHECFFFLPFPGAMLSFVWNTPSHWQEYCKLTYMCIFMSDVALVLTSVAQCYRSKPYSCSISFMPSQSSVHFQLKLALLYMNEASGRHVVLSLTRLL